MKKSILKKIKDMFLSIFSSKKLLKEGNAEELKIYEKETNNQVIESERKNIFEQAEEQRNLLSLQKAYLQGRIKEEDMTKEQINALENLFDMQIENVKRENLNLRRKVIKFLMDDKEIMSIYEKARKGELSEEQLTEDQIEKIEILFEFEIEKMKMQKLQYKSEQV